MGNAMIPTSFPDTEENTEHQSGSPAYGVKITVMKSFDVGLAGEKERAPYWFCALTAGTDQSSPKPMDNVKSFSTMSANA